jgi:hypothetical protein
MILDIVVRAWHSAEIGRDRAVVENALIAAAWKGSGGSGNWGHTSTTRVGQGRGFRSWRGLAAIGAAPESTPQERHAASAQTRW